MWCCEVDWLVWFINDVFFIDIIDDDVVVIVVFFVCLGWIVCS